MFYNREGSQETYISRHGLQLTIGSLPNRAIPRPELRVLASAAFLAYGR